MSTVYMCDNCGNLFSVNERGWEQYTKQKSTTPNPNRSYSGPALAMGDYENRRGVDYDNAHNHGAATFHTCAACAMGEASVVRPRVALAELPSGRITSDKREVHDAEILEGRNNG